MRLAAPAKAEKHGQTDSTTQRSACKSLCFGCVLPVEGYPLFANAAFTIVASTFTPNSTSSESSQATPKRLQITEEVESTQQTAKTLIYDI